MVLLEIAAGNGAAVLSGLVKVSAVAGAGKSSAALLVPAVSLAESAKVLPGAVVPQSFTALGAHFSTMVCNAMAALTELERSALGIAAASVSFGGLMHYSGLMSSPEEGEEPSDAASLAQGDDEKPSSGWMVPAAIRAFAIADCCLVGIVVHSLGQPLTVPLRTWALGGLALSFPTSWAIQRATEHYGFRCAFVLESGAVVAGFVWLAWGTSLLIQFPQGAHIAPLLWGTSFGQCVVVWSVTSVALSSMMLTTVLSLLPLFMESKQE